MSEPEPLGASQIDVELMRQIDAVCRRFEADWRAGARPPVDSYLANVPDEARPPLRAELNALERELRQSEETVTGGESSSASEAPTTAPAGPPTLETPGETWLSMHENATVSRMDATLEHGSSSGALAADALPGRVRYFGDYEIIREIARGGMGVVFEARQVSLNRSVALKMILTGQLADETDVKRFYTEAEAAANLDHPGIVPIYEVGRYEGQHYFSMGFVDGKSLSQRLADGPLAPRESAELLLKVAEAIEFAHQHGVVHRDLKPANILLDKNGSPRVTDFGLAKKLQTDSGLTGSGQIMGTPSYMPPEQARGTRGEVAPAADVYALGATLYAMLTGRPPFQAATTMDTLNQVINEEPVPPRRLNASIPLDVETICLKCLQKEPAKRYAGAAALANELGRYIAGEPIAARPVTRWERAVKWARRRPAIAGLTAAVALVTVLGLGGILWQWGEAVQARNEADRQSQNAKGQAKLAESRRQEAELRRNDALRAQIKERLQTELAERRLYDVRMNLVQRSWDKYDGKLFQQGLANLLPANQGGSDRRGFEWFYWQRRQAAGHVTLRASARAVRSVAFSPDGKQLASASTSGSVVWDIPTAHVVRTFPDTKGPVCFSPDSRRLATIGRDGSVKVWEIHSGAESLTLTPPAAQVVTSVAFSPDCKTLAISENEPITMVSTGGPLRGRSTVKLWEAATGRAVLTLDGDAGVKASVVFRPDGDRLVTASSDATVKVWDAKTGREILPLKGNTSAAWDAAFSPDGRRLATAAGWSNSVKVWDAETGREVVTLTGHGSAVNAVAFSPNGALIASASYDETAKVWNASTGKESFTLKGHTGWVNDVEFSPDGKKLASASEDGTVKLWHEFAAQEALTIGGHTISITSVAFSPGGDRLATASRDRTVKVWDAETGRGILTLRDFTGEVTSVAFSPDGMTLATADSEPIGPGPDGKLARGRSTVKLWDAATGRPMRTLKEGDSDVKSVAFSPDGKRLASGWNKTVLVWDVETGRETLSLAGHGHIIWSVAFSPDGTRLASASEDRTARVWDAASGQPLLTFNKHSRQVASVAFSPDGKRIATASYDRTVKVWDAASGQENLTCSGHTSVVHCVAFSPDGSRLASGSIDRSIRVWDAMTGLETLVFRGDLHIASAVAFSPDGHRLAGISSETTVKVWDARPLDNGTRAPESGTR